MDKFTCIHVFGRIVELGSFIAVARERKLSAMMISKYIAQLERELGVSLLNRTTRQISLTEAGERFYRQSKSIMEDLSGLEEQTRELGHTVKGTLRIVAPIDFGSTQLVPIVAAYQAIYPDVKVSLVLDNGMVNLAAGNFDCAIRVTDIPEASLVARKITETPLCLFASPDYLRRQGRPQTIDDLKQHQCLHYLNTPHGDYWVFNQGKRVRKIRLEWRFGCNNSRALGEAATLGLGVVQAPELFLRHLIESGAVEEILPAMRPDSIPIYATYLQRKFIPSKLSTFVNFLVEYFQSTPQRAG
ncbi:MAG: LysR family transcriptional regulator [Methylococcales bacterium]|nr:LysR family transcriptional regulator [Methylococcaceae bacterium]HIL40412.1 LysR family transcriptional regulator [Methylococcales bacterium]